MLAFAILRRLISSHGYKDLVPFRLLADGTGQHIVALTLPSWKPAINAYFVAVNVRQAGSPESHPSKTGLLDVRKL